MSRLPEVACIKLPRGTLKKIREITEDEGSLPSEFMRRAIIKAIKETNARDFDAA